MVNHWTKLPDFELFKWKQIVVLGNFRRSKVLLEGQKNNKFKENTTNNIFYINNKFILHISELIKDKNVAYKFYRKPPEIQLLNKCVKNSYRGII